MLKHVFSPPTAESKILRYGFNRANLNKVYELPFQIKNDIMFQYKLIHNILPTKVSLFKAKISDSDLCPQCLTDRHSLDHMFLHCSSTLFFWNLFQNWWSSKTKEKITLSNSMILYGILDKKTHSYSLNYTLLIAKYSIFCKCLHDEKLCFESFLSLLKERLNLIYKEKLRSKITNCLNSKKYMEIFCSFFFVLFFCLINTCTLSFFQYYYFHVFSVSL